MNNKKPSYYQNARIPAVLFYDILESGDINLLVKKGKPTKNQLEKAFSNIFDEFFELKNDSKMRLVLKTKKEVIRLYRKIAIIEAIVLSLVSFRFPDDKIEMLVDHLSKVGITVNKENNLDKELLNVLKTSLAGYRNILALEEHNLKELTKGVKSTFEDSLVSLEGVIGYAIDDTVTLKKYLSYEKRATKKANNGK